MNAQRRQHLKGAIALIERALAVIEAASEEERDALDNLPENLSASERAEKMELDISAMDEAIGELEAAEDLLRAVIS